MQVSPKIVTFSAPIGTRGGPLAQYDPSHGMSPPKGGGPDDGGGDGGGDMNQQCPGCHPFWYFGTAIGGILLIATLFGGRS